MNQREAKRLACRLASSAIERLMESGWPFEMVDEERGSVAGVLLEDDDGRPIPDGLRLQTALDALVQELFERGRGTAGAQAARSAVQVACATDGDFGRVDCSEPEPTTARLEQATAGGEAIDPQDYDPELAAALAGADFIHWPGAGPDDAPIQFGAHCPCSAQDAAMTLQHRIHHELPRADRVRTLALLLRAHGADVREVGS